ncbi:MAG: (d)CMP kinase [Casimicrobium sp.]
MTIDGPAASGKGTVARALAKALGFHLLDSGAIYRAFALSCIDKKINTNNFNELENESKVLSLVFEGENLFLNGANATERIRREEVGMLASKLSAIPKVRRGLHERQRAFAQAPGLVADGRDMGTVVFPEATLKIYLTTSASVRAERRYGQLKKQFDAARGAFAEAPNEEAKRLIEKGNSLIISSSLESLASVEAKIRQRDTQDKTRAVAPLKPSLDAIVIDNSLHRPEQTVEAVLSLWALRNA